MKSCATYDDVNLVLRLYEMRREENLRQARAWFTKSFYARDLVELNEIAPPGSEHNAYFRMVVSFWDMAASFITNDVLQAELFFHSGRELLLVWERIRELVPHLRESRKDPTFAENLEAVAGQYIEWLNKRSPGAYEAFRERMARPAG